MRTIIAGSRSLRGVELVDAAVQASGFVVTAVLSGTARGIDRDGERWAEGRSLVVERYPADWSTGPGAGYERNVRMVENAEALIAIWDGLSGGTAHVVKAASVRGLRVYVHRVSDASDSFA